MKQVWNKPSKMYLPGLVTTKTQAFMKEISFLQIMNIFLDYKIFKMVSLLQILDWFTWQVQSNLIGKLAY